MSKILLVISHFAIISKAWHVDHAVLDLGFDKWEVLTKQGGPLIGSTDLMGCNLPVKHLVHLRTSSPLFFQNAIQLTLCPDFNSGKIMGVHLAFKIP